MTSAFDHPWLGGLFADPEMAALWSAGAQLESMRRFECAWSLALGASGLAPLDQAGAAASAIAAMSFDIADLRQATARDGVVVPQLVAQMKAAAGPAAAAVHRGATSQDVIDTATVLSIKASLDLLRSRLTALIAGLVALDKDLGQTPLMGRTRMQAATWITASDRIQPWREPLRQHLLRLDQLAPRVLLVQVGGASGDRRDLGDKASQVTARVADSLGLGAPARAWHTMRDGLAEFAGLLSLISGTLGKMGQDIALMAQQGVDDISLSGGGRSSAMPHKQNPVLAELLVTLARYNAGALAQMHQALVHEQERSGAAWALEWLVLPGMAITAGRALTVARELTQQIRKIGTPG